jgi:hypothetical protein
MFSSQRTVARSVGSSPTEFPSPAVDEIRRSTLKSPSPTGRRARQLRTYYPPGTSIKRATKFFSGQNTEYREFSADYAQTTRRLRAACSVTILE